MQDHKRSALISLWDLAAHRRVVHTLLEDSDAIFLLMLTSDTILSINTQTSQDHLLEVFIRGSESSAIVNLRR